MSRLSNKLRGVSFGTAGTGIAHLCPGCNEMHVIRTEGTSPVWIWNKDVNLPTVSPSIRVSRQYQNAEVHVCHYFLRLGQIEFCNDSTHDLHGQVVEIPDLPLERD